MSTPLEQSPYKAHLEAAKDAASKGAQIAREGRERDLKTISKSVGDYVSEIDIKIDECVTNALKTAFPEIPVISEELCPAFDELPDTCWIVDPLDGTNSYLAGARLELTSCMIALRDQGKTVAAVVHFPFTDEVYSSVRGCGAFLDDAPISVPKEASLSEAWVAMNHYGDQSLETDFFAQVRDGLRAKGGAYMVTIDPPGSGLALRITDGRDTLGAVVHDNNSSKRKQELWDVVPIKLIVEEAGGVFLNEVGESYEPTSCRPIIVAANAEMARAIIAMAKA